MKFILAYLGLLPILFLAGPTIHIYQLESYQTPGFLHSIKRSWFRILIPLLFAAFVPALGGTVLFLTPAHPWFAYGLAAVLTLIVGVTGWQRFRKQPAKKPLVYTSRIKRLLIITAIILFIPSGICMALIPEMIGLAATHIAGALLLPCWILIGGLCISPIEKLIQKWYFRDAQKRLCSNPELIRIGITGSYGKTSSKVILGTILSEQYKTLYTPGSYNTTMGVTRTIRSDLKPEHEVFIAEMGARHVGDITEICRLVQPTYGLITSIGPQHLETFKTQERINTTKYELIKALPEQGCAFFPADGGICEQLYEKTKHVSKWLFGLERPRAAVSAREIHASSEGSDFILVTRDGRECLCRTKLLGRHNIQNILGCVAVALELGLTLEQISAGISKLKPVEHRLQLIPTGNGTTVIDDAFNSNPAGAAAALEVLSSFAGRHMIITPGLVELGELEESENVEFGRKMADAVDYALLVARNAAAMERGLLEKGFPKERIIKTGTLQEASQALTHLIRTGDTVLFENDLPDQYEK